MKKLAGLGLALVLLALSSPVFAKPTLTYYCWYVEGNACPGPGQTTTCTDACNYYYTCNCIYWGGQYVWDCPEVC